MNTIFLAYFVDRFHPSQCLKTYLRLELGGVELSFLRVTHCCSLGMVVYSLNYCPETGVHYTAERVALKYKELWQVEQVFRDVKSVLDSRPVFHKRDETIRGHVFCSFLALVLRKALDRRLESCDYQFE